MIRILVFNVNLLKAFLRAVLRIFLGDLLVDFGMWDGDATGKASGTARPILWQRNVATMAGNHSASATLTGRFTSYVAVAEVS